MLFQPKDIYEKLEFDKILHLLMKECLGELGKEAIQALPFHSSKPILDSILQEVKEYKLSITEKDHFPLQAYEEIREDLKMLSIEDYVLPIEGLQRINNILISIQAIFKFFKNSSRKETYPSLHDIIRDVVFDPELISTIEKVIDEEGNIKPDASPDLLKIFKQKQSKERELDRQFRSIITHYRSKGWLTDNVESFRNGRRVLSVPAEYKRKIRGIIHDESATGRTVFIEPEGIIDINNDIFNLENEYKREIYRILKALSTTLRPYCLYLEEYLLLMIRFDVIQAKAQLAIKLNAEMPVVKPIPCFNVENGFHPLLFLKNKKEGKKTVPFNLTFHHNNRVLVLSGPNAGGKSITLKSVGLLQMMLQAGMLVPVEATSEMGLFEKIFADIGDQQSLEDDLSTYSSHLQNMKQFVDKANEKTLVLIDEFGSGTDPKIGGAIAESILRELSFKKIYGVITTHYSNLKVFAFKTRGIINGSMTFDKDNLSPTYELKVGRPGSSYAYEIAQKSGLSSKILKYARHKTGKNEKAVDQLLVDLQREKQELEEKIQTLENKEKQLDKLIKSYEVMEKDYEFKRKKLKLEAKQQALQQVAQENKKYEKLVREIKEEKNLEKAKELAAQARQDRKQLSVEVNQLNEAVYYKKTSKLSIKKGEITVGDYVKLKTGGTTGKVESINKKSATILMGEMRMQVKLRDLEHANEPLEIKRQKSIKINTLENNAKFDSKLDLRGMRREEALKTIEVFIDEALLSSAASLRIIHGKGNGVLRNAVKIKLKEYDVKFDIRHPEDEYGGDGVTLVDIL